MSSSFLLLLSATLHVVLQTTVPRAKDRRVTTDPSPSLVLAHRGVGAFFTNKSAEQELEDLVKSAQVAALQILTGARSGPISLGYATEDMFDRLVSGLWSMYRLSWGSTADFESAVQGKEDGGSFGLILFWGDPNAMHDEVGEWVQRKTRDQLSG